MADPLTADPQDFRSRYSAETAGMPANLAAIASQNLASTDASLTRVNAAARLNPLPTPGSTYATPQTDAENYGIASAMSGNSSSTASSPTLADTHADDIAQRRSDIADQLTQIKTKLGVVPPAPGTAVVLARSRDHAQLLQNWHMLEQEDRGLLAEHHDLATEAARDAHETFARNSHIQSANDFADMASELSQLHQDSNVKPGTPEYQTAALAIAQKHPFGFMSQAGQTLFRSVSDTHDKAAELEDRSYWQRYGQAFKEASQVARKFGTDVQYDGQGFPSIDATAQSGGGSAAAESVPSAVQTRYAKLQADAQMHEELSAKEATDNTKAKKADVPYSKAPQYHATQAEIAQLEKRFPGLAPTPDDTTPAVTAAPAPTLSPADQAAITWANANPKDPRSIAIKKLHGIE